MRRTAADVEGVPAVRATQRTGAGDVHGLRQEDRSPRKWILIGVVVVFGVMIYLSYMVMMG